jgi:hypothetical protein
LSSIDDDDDDDVDDGDDDDDDDVIRSILSILKVHLLMISSICIVRVPILGRCTAKAREILISDADEEAPR